VIPIVPCLAKVIGPLYLYLMVIVRVSYGYGYTRRSGRVVIFGVHWVWALVSIIGYGYRSGS